MCPAPGGLSKKLHAKAAAEKQQSITLVNQSFDERKIVVMRSDASDKTAKQNESDDHFRLADHSELTAKHFWTPIANSAAVKLSAVTSLPPAHRATGQIVIDL
jgi:hypothetical protein